MYFEDSFSLAGRSELTMMVHSVENHVEIIYIVLDPSFSLNEISKDYIGISEYMI